MTSTTCSSLKRATRAFEALLPSLPPAAGSVDLHSDDTHNGLLWLTLNRPEKRNAITASMMLDLARHVEDIRGRHDVRAVVLRGAGSHFCAGADFGLAKALRTPEHGLCMLDLMTTVLDSFHLLPCVTVAAVQGFAKGGGAELLTASDFRVFGNVSPHVQFVHTNMGISPGWGGALRLRELVGRQKAIQLVAMAKILEGGAMAEDWGLADCVVDEKDRGDGSSFAAVDRGAISFLRPILESKSITAVRATKQAIAGSGFSCIHRATERNAFASVWGAEDNQRAVITALKGLGESTVKASNK